MGIFSRKQGLAASSGPTTGSPDFIGRKFLSSLSIQECLSNFSAVKDECYSTVGPMRDIEWQMPIGLPERTSQGLVPTAPPDKVVASDLVGGGQIYLALWDSGVSYGPGRREMWFVPPGFDGSPIPIAGRWKMRDGSLSSIGSVESTLWGVR
jgi:hypothetical protein